MLFSNILFIKYFNALTILGTLGFFCVYCQKDLAVGKEINRTAKIIKTMVSFFSPVSLNQNRWEFLTSDYGDLLDPCFQLFHWKGICEPL